MSFSFWNSDKSQKMNLNINEGASWSQVSRELDSPEFNSLWEAIDNGDDVVQKSELDLLNNLLELTNKSSKEEKIIKSKDVKKILKLRDEGKLENALGQAPIGLLHTSEMKNFSYLGVVKTKDGELLTKEGEFVRINVDFSALKNKTGEYNIVDYSIKKNNDGSYTKTAIGFMAKPDKQNPNNPWSEGIDREVSVVKIGRNYIFNNLEKELKQYGKEFGFKVEILYAAGNFPEDSTIQRHDGKNYVTIHNDASFIQKDDKEELIGNRAHITEAGQGVVAKDALSEKMLFYYNKKYIEKSNTYLEGGNILNTLTADGEPGAIIGDESITYSLKAMQLKKHESNIWSLKNTIAKDLGLKPDNVTYIPQFDFHIDMYYRPLHKGQIAVPDFQAAIEFLEGDNKINNMGDAKRQKLIQELTNLAAQTKPFTDETNKKLEEDGYQLVKVPCFTLPEDPTINHLNGFGGTTTNGISYFITNKSDYPEIDKYVEQFYKQAGIDEIRFAKSSKAFLKNFGGMDCLTIEM